MQEMGKKFITRNTLIMQNYSNNLYKLIYINYRFGSSSINKGNLRFKSPREVDRQIIEFQSKTKVTRHISRFKRLEIRANDPSSVHKCETKDRIDMGNFVKWRSNGR